MGWFILFVEYFLLCQWLYGQLGPKCPIWQASLWPVQSPVSLRVYRWGDGQFPYSVTGHVWSFLWEAQVPHTGLREGLMEDLVSQAGICMLARSGSGKGFWYGSGWEVRQKEWHSEHLARVDLYSPHRRWTTFTLRQWEPLHWQVSSRGVEIPDFYFTGKLV